LEGVVLLSAGTVLQWDLKARSISKHHYWAIDEIKQLSGRIDEVELAEELGRVFKSSVERRSVDGGRVGLTLSGGLDSRAILAAMPNSEIAIQTLTFGKENCEDSKIASIAAAEKGAKHHTFEMTSANWLQPRVEAVWKTDGELDLMHMHVISMTPNVKDYFDVSLDGCGANGIIGDSWTDLQMSGPAEYIDSRTRRFLVLGPTVVRSHIEGRFPFFDNRFLELALAVPEAHKKNNRIYRMMLLKAFPSFFRGIPWQRTGSPIKWPNSRELLEKRIRDKGNRVLDILSAYRLLRRTNRGYADYESWIRQEPARTMFQDILSNPSALYTEFIPRESVMNDLARHLGGRNFSETLGRILTIEIWLQQVFEGRFRSNENWFASSAN
jgi:asparagine synthase (glutamine-hydrolysing)